MSYMWVNMDVLGTYIDSSLSIEDKVRVFKILDNIRKSLNYNKILFSLNSCLTFDKLRQTLTSIEDICLEAKVSLEIGPLFGDEGSFEEGQIIGREELFCANKANKIIWYLQRNPDKNIKSIFFIDDLMFVEGVILSRQLKNNDISLYLAHTNSELTELVANIDIPNSIMYEGRRNDKFLLKSVEYFLEEIRRDKVVRNRCKVNK